MDLGDFQSADKIKFESNKVVKGKITNLSPKEGRYGLRLDTPGIEDCWINGLGEAPGQVGDEIELEYTLVAKPDGGFWYNVVKAMNLNKPDTKPIVLEENKQIEALASKLDNFTDFANLMKASVDLCIRRGTLMDSEIIATFGKLIDWIETYSQLNDTTKLSPNANTNTGGQKEQKCQK